ncbi:MAG TPA: CRTAC1 family protein [Polyangiaceae bacterium]
MRRIRVLSRAAFGLMVVSGTALGAPITFTDIAQDPAAGIAYRRVFSTIVANYDAFKLRPFIALPEVTQGPIKAHGAPGVALWDYDLDGDLDMYVTNGPGRANSLYQNRLKQTGKTRFVDVAGAAGVAAPSQDSTGVCYGDIDNDGDEDLFVLGRMERNRLFRNNGNGSFSDISAASGLGNTVKGHTSCSMGDVNGDGLLDVFVANTFDWARREAIMTELFSYNHTNDLYVNRGGNTFQDVSDSSGVRVLFNVPAGDGTISWASAMLDIDLDGDIDIVHADDQGGMPNSGFRGVDRGFIQVHKNDGTGRFTNATQALTLQRFPSSWMGLAFADLNSDGRMDMFGTSLGDWMNAQLGIPLPPGFCTSAWYLAQPNGTFDRPDYGPLFVTPFGWGTGAFDYDNDSDSDLVYYGSMEALAFMTADNPGVVLANDGTGTLSWDRAATIRYEEHVQRQQVQGVALGDLNNDGFTDVTYVSSNYAPAALPLVPASHKWNSPFDAVAHIVPAFTPIGPLEFEWSGVDYQQGFMGVQLSSASTGNRWVKIRTVGSKGVTALGKNNRSGIGATIKFTPAGGKTAMTPVLGGSSYASQHSLVQGFGLSTKTSGMAEVLWPGGVKNRLYDVRHGETLTIPEIPCNFMASTGRPTYRTCVDKALADLSARGVISAAERGRLRSSALRAYDETH